VTHLEPAQLIVRNEPIYPALAVQTHVSGTVEVRFHIRVDGTVHDVSVVKGTPVLAKAAAEAVQTWRYEPARLNGTSIESEGRAVLAFHPPGD
jgi:TonB family protein